MKENQRCDVFVGSALRVPGGNPVDGSPPARHMGTVAKPGRLRPTQNDEPMENFIALT